ncbi:MAG: hypothetical protein OEU26_27950 [Candidatus Tectomicrobia bacterium]|nr:hypothetical protein [Candidatus Tectomicrobia bacterium]
MDAPAFISALQGISNTLGQLSLQATEPDDPLAFPEPRSVDEIANFDKQLSAIRGQVDEKHHSLLNTALRDYRAGFPDRVGAYLVELIEKVQKEPGYAQDFSADSQQQVEFCLADLREL